MNRNLFNQREGLSANVGDTRARLISFTFPVTRGRFRAAWPRHDPLDTLRIATLLPLIAPTSEPFLCIQIFIRKLFFTN